ncbi:hypothetical protein PIB30_056506 [Stylosanthes scabra]|uniref:Putative plant transposon protein domain-containing protein n=1 Tax=Stylosanthes scabra TaxID=79078 RepID=A0ABU6XJM4_9FABA|nr:hypothetical protein [Stylosanthes scabra]
MLGNQDLDDVIRDLCVEGLVWALGARNNPLYLKRSNLNSIERGWHEFVIQNIMPTTNQSEVTIKRAVLIHYIMHGQEVRVEKIIVDAMMNIINKIYTSKPPLAFPNIIACLCEAMEISYSISEPNEAVPKARPTTAAMMENIRYPPLHPPQPQQHFYQEQPAGNDAQIPRGYGWGQLREDMANLKTTQIEFYESILAQQASQGLRLNEIEVKQKDMCAEQTQFYEDVRAYHAQQQEYQRQQQE